MPGHAHLKWYYFDEKTQHKIMLGFILKMYIGLLSFSGSLASMVNVSSLTCIFWMMIYVWQDLLLLI